MKLRLKNTITREGDIKEFIFQPPEGFSWTAGQYMHYVLPHDADDRGTERWFTISAAPSEKEVRITTRINQERSSSFKTHLATLQPGTEIEADGPEGDFILDDPNREYLFIVGGIGITPVRSILTEAQHNGIHPRATLLYANRTQAIPFRAELDALSDTNPLLSVAYIVEPAHLDEQVLRAALASLSNPLVYISGPEGMVKALAEQVNQLGVDNDAIKIDDFPGYAGI